MSHVHIVCSARDAGPWLDALLASLQAQTHTDWELAIRDDGSRDATWDVIERWRTQEPRITRTIRGETSVGTAAGFGGLLAALPPTAQAIATADADDVWLPDKLALSLATMRRQPDVATVPILVHTDLRPVDVALHTLAPSFWRHVGLDPVHASPRLVAIQNVAVGPTQLFNRPLLDAVRTIPADAICQDWWIALVASAIGRLVPIDHPTVLYRRHGTNDSAARAHGVDRVRQLARVALDGARTGRQLDEASRQAGAAVQRFGARMEPRARDELASFARIAGLRGLARKRAIARWRWHPGHSALRNAAMVVRG